MLIHHYTNIETLALILQSKKIRFNRLDRMDDLEEGRVEAQDTKVGKYTYVSCWTEDEESIPMWYMYAGKEMGVRISLPQDMFKDYSFIDGFSGLNVSDILRAIDPDNAPIMLWKIPGSEYKGKNYLIIPVESDKPATFYRRIVYVNDVLSLTKELALMVDNNEEDCYYNFDLGNVGVLKNKRWDFQKESRFILRIIPTDGEISLCKPKELVAKLKEALDTEMEPHFNSYDLPLKDDIFDHMIVTLSPSITEGKRLIVEALLNQYAPSAKIKESSLSKLVQMK